MPTMPGGGVAQAAADTLALLLQADQELRRRAMAVPSAAPGRDPLRRRLCRGAGPLPVGPWRTRPRGGAAWRDDARVGLLPGLRTPDMLKFNGVSGCVRVGRGIGCTELFAPSGLALPPWIPDPIPPFLTLINTPIAGAAQAEARLPTDLAGLTDEEKVERRKQQAREYSAGAGAGREMKVELIDEVEDLGFMRTSSSGAPRLHGALGRRPLHGHPLRQPGHQVPVAPGRRGPAGTVSLKCGLCVNIGRMIDRFGLGPADPNAPFIRLPWLMTRVPASLTCPCDRSTINRSFWKLIHASDHAGCAFAQPARADQKRRRSAAVPRLHVVCRLLRAHGRHAQVRLPGGRVLPLGAFGKDGIRD